MPDSDDHLTAAMARRLLRRADVTGRIVIPAAPALLEEYVEMLDSIFLGLGAEFSEAELDALRGVLHAQLSEAFTASPRSEIVIEYDSPQGLVVNYQVHAHWSSVGAAYDRWTQTRQPPYFGTEPDARLLALSVAVADPAACPALDIGAGSGRNAVTLARRGHPVDAVEVSAKMAEELQESARRESLGLRVITADIFTSAAELRSDYGLIVVSEVTSDFRGTDELRALFDIAGAHLAPGGQLLLNAFIARDDYIPDAAAREFAQQCYSAFYTRDELAAAHAGLGLELIDDASVHDYEKAHLPAAAWPPTPWYADWTTGRDVFDLPREECPIELRWLLFRRAD